MRKFETAKRANRVTALSENGRASSGKRTKALAELVDVYQTVCDVMGVALPDDTVPFDGVSLRPVLEAPDTATVKDVALSTFPRCAHKGIISAVRSRIYACSQR